jgi:pentatricopeptide repeat-containing protein PET309
MSKPENGQYQEAWNLYCRAEESDKGALRGQLLIYLSRSDGVVDTGRVISLFRQIPVDQWTDEVLASGIRALLRVGSFDSAMESFKTGLQSAGLTGGLEYILFDAFISRKWQDFLAVWFEYSNYQKRVRRAPLDVSPFVNLRKERTAADLFFAFDRYVAEQGIASLKFANFKTFSKEALQVSRRVIAESALLYPCQPVEAERILSKFDSTSLYKLYLDTMLDRIEQNLESRLNMVKTLSLYQKYRELPGAEFSRSLLRNMFNLYHAVYRPGLEEIYRDWHRPAAGGLDKWAYEKFLAYYASVGDVTAVRDLWSRYVAAFPSVLTEPKAFYNTLNAYAQAANITGAEKELQTMAAHGLTPDVTCLNSLLSCYVRANADEKAESHFQEICAAHKANATTFGHMMIMTARKGDLEGTIAFFNKARVAGIQPSADMIYGLSQAYLRNDRLLEAEHICTELAERRTTSTSIWNQLLYYNALNGRVEKCYQLLRNMGNFGVEWNHETYEHLLHALVRVNQVQSAYKLLRSACKESVFPIAPEHFAIVMDGAVRAGQYELVETIYPLLEYAGVPTTFNIQLALFEGAYKRSPTANRTRSLGRGLADHLRSMIRSDADQTLSNEPSLKPGIAGDIMSLKKQTRRVSHAIRLLTKMREFSTAEELVSLYARVIPSVENSEPLPPNIIASLMYAYIEIEDYERVVSLWEVTWDSVYKRSRRPNGKGIYAAFEYNLTQPIVHIARVCKVREDGAGLLNIVQQARDAGFNFTRSTWNILIRYLAELNQWEPAMKWCETMLMPRWRGWSPGPSSPQERRELSNTRVLRASKPTVLSLQREWLRLRKLAVWSSQVSNKLKEIEHKYPMLHFAFTTTDFDNLPETWAQTAGKLTSTMGPMDEIPISLTKGAKQILEPINLAELKKMRKTLKKSLRAERRKEYRRKVERKKLRVRMRFGSKPAVQRSRRNVHDSS